MRVDQAHMMPETIQSLTVTDKEVGAAGHPPVGVISVRHLFFA